MTLACRRCGRDHGPIPESLALELPDAALDVAAAEREDRVIVGDDCCQVDQARFFLRGEVRLASRDLPSGTFSWRLWVEVPRRDFKRALARWTRPDRQSGEPISGRLASSLPGYPPCFGLHATVQMTPPGSSLQILLEDEIHPLAQHAAGGLPDGWLVDLTSALFHER